MEELKRINDGIAYLDGMQYDKLQEGVFEIDEIHSILSDIQGIYRQETSACYMARVILSMGNKKRAMIKKTKSDTGGYILHFITTPDAEIKCEFPEHNMTKDLEILCILFSTWRKKGDIEEMNISRNLVLAGRDFLRNMRLDEEIYGAFNNAKVTQDELEAIRSYVQPYTYDRDVKSALTLIYGETDYFCITKEDESVDRVVIKIDKVNGGSVSASVRCNIDTTIQDYNYDVILAYMGIFNPGSRPGDVDKAAEQTVSENQAVFEALTVLKECCLRHEYNCNGCPLAIRDAACALKRSETKPGTWELIDPTQYRAFPG